MKRRLIWLPILLVAASVPALRTAVHAQDGVEDHGNYNDDKESDDAKPAEDAKPPNDAPPPAADSGDGAKGDENKGNENNGDDKGMVSIKIISSEGEKPAVAEVSVSDTPKPKTMKKAAKAKTKNVPVKTALAVKKAVVPPPAPPPLPPAVPLTPVEPRNP